MIKTLQTLCTLDAPSGREAAVREYILEQLRQSSVDMDVQVDALGNILVQVTGRKRAVRRVMFAAHMDEVALMITGITQDGYLRFEPIGGIDPQVLFGAHVRIGSVRGVIGGKAVHQCSAKERESVPKSLLIDIGAQDKQQAEQMVSVADTAVFDAQQATLAGGLFRSRAIDDRAGCALLLHLLKETPEYDILVAFTVQEEVGLRGAKIAARRVKPDMAIILDTTTANDMGMVDSHKQVTRCGDGPALTIMDRRAIIPQKMRKIALDAAEKRGIPVQMKRGNSGGTDAGEIHLTGAGVECLVIVIPCRYCHSGVSVCKLSDIENAGKLAMAVLEDL